MTIALKLRFGRKRRKSAKDNDIRCLYWMSAGTGFLQHPKDVGHRTPGRKAEKLLKEEGLAAERRYRCAKASVNRLFRLLGCI